MFHPTSAHSTPKAASNVTNFPPRWVNATTLTMLMSVATLPFLVGLVGLHCCAAALELLGTKSEALLQGEQLPNLPFP